MSFVKWTVSVIYLVKMTQMTFIIKIITFFLQKLLKIIGYTCSINWINQYDR